MSASPDDSVPAAALFLRAPTRSLTVHGRRYLHPQALDRLSAALGDEMLSLRLAHLWDYATPAIRAAIERAAKGGIGKDYAAEVLRILEERREPMEERNAVQKEVVERAVKGHARAAELEKALLLLSDSDVLRLRGVSNKSLQLFLEDKAALSQGTSSFHQTGRMELFVLATEAAMQAVVPGTGMTVQQLVLSLKLATLDQLQEKVAYRSSPHERVGADSKSDSCLVSGIPGVRGIRPECHHIIPVNLDPAMKADLIARCAIEYPRLREGCGDEVIPPYFETAGPIIPLRFEIHQALHNRAAWFALPVDDPGHSDANSADTAPVAVVKRSVELIYLPDPADLQRRLRCVITDVPDTVAELMEMGCDGGFIPKRIELVKTKEAPPRQDTTEMERARWTLCALSKEPLRDPVVADDLGNLFNKDALLVALVDRSLPAAFGHIRGLADLIAVAPKAPVSQAASAAAAAAAPAKTSKARRGPFPRFVCPLTGLEAGSGHRFVLMRGCGCVLSEKALAEVPSDKCLSCGAPVTEVVTLNGNPDDVARLRAQMEARRATEKPKKRKSAKRAADAAPEAAEAPAAKREKTKIAAPAGADERVFKSLFHTQEQANARPAKVEDMFLCKTGTGGVIV
eukprot:m51a1_g8783 hypothetical protein (628) ;mRNA; r:199242-205977